MHHVVCQLCMHRNFCIRNDTESVAALYATTSGVARAFRVGESPTRRAKTKKKMRKVRVKIRKVDGDLRKNEEIETLAHPGLWGWLRPWLRLTYPQFSSSVCAGCVWGMGMCGGVCGCVLLFFPTYALKLRSIEDSDIYYFFGIRKNISKPTFWEN